MQWKQYLHYQIDFKSRWVQPSAVLMGLSFFFRIVCFFGLRFVSDWSFFDVLFHMIFPLLLGGAYIVLLRAVRVNAPGLYAILGAGLCVLMFLWSFSGGNIWYILLCFVYYIASGAVLIATAGGFLPGKLLSSAMFLVPFILRFLRLNVFSIMIDGLFLELSVLLQLAALFCLTRSFKEGKRRSPEAAQKRI